MRDQYQMGLITEQERYEATVDVWSETTDAGRRSHPGAPAGIRLAVLHGELGREG